MTIRVAERAARFGVASGARTMSVPKDERIPARLREIYIYADMAAEYKGVHISTIIRHIHKGTLQGDLLGTKWAVVRDGLEEWTPDAPGNPNWRG